MRKTVTTILISAIIFTALSVGATTIVELPQENQSVRFLDGMFTTKKLGATVTTIQGTDTLKASRSVINTNFTNLNTDKVETSTTTMTLLTSAPNLTNIGTIADFTTTNLISTNSTSTNATTTDFHISSFLNFGGDVFNELVGTGLQLVSGALEAVLGTSIDAGEITAGAIDGDDINSNLAGRSLTLTGASPDTLDADTELYTGSISFNVASSTMSTTTTVAIHRFSTAVTITQASGSCDSATTTVNAEIRASATPYTAGTDVFGGGFNLSSDFSNSSSTPATTAVAAGVPFAFVIDDAEPTGSKSSFCELNIKYTEND